ncbi:hypothetical protein J8V46_10450 [Xenorhabdus sp. PB30.3]|uniref:hypothetical protein n=1 Tax=Xenorhabdus sp. PB30.3 TaxID=2788941 RepID=UPI001E4D24CE|nr:hypothetical protein [Xenorhabdus sp. PB30.3]MCC8380177.1 hypothetical protein [Xenorhabdus sp. PB30.3]
MNGVACVWWRFIEGAPEMLKATEWLTRWPYLRFRYSTSEMYGSILKAQLVLSER